MPNASVKIKLDNDIQVNGVLIPAGTQDVPADVAEDWKNIDDEHNKYKASLHQNNKLMSEGPSISAS